MITEEDVLRYFEREVNPQRYRTLVNLISSDESCFSGVVSLTSIKGYSPPIALSFNFVSGVLHCSQIDIPPPHAQNGLGASLVKGMEAFARDRGISKAYFPVSNPRFWEGKGYTISKEKGCKYATKILK